MFVVEGMERVRCVIEENRKRKPPIQQLYEKREDHNTLISVLEKHKKHLEKYQKKEKRDP